MKSENNNPIDLSDKNPCFARSDDVSEIIKPLEKLGITYFGFTRVEKSGGRIFLTNEPEMLKYYIKEKYYLNGNTEGEPEKYPSQAVIWSTLPNQRVYDEVARVRGIDHGMYLIQAHEEYCDFFNFATHKGNESIINTYLNKMDYLEKFTECFKAQAHTLIREVEKKKIILPFNENTLLLKDSNLSLENLLISDKNKKIKLSLRQIDVSKNLLQGKSIKEIALELHLSARTVETYVNQLKLKFGCRKINELIIELLKTQSTSKFHLSA